MNGDSRLNVDAPEVRATLGGRDARIEIESLQNLLMLEWQRVLGPRQIGMDDDFFDLGGDSLLAVQLHTRVQTGIGQAIPLLSLFQKPTVGQMATTLLEQNWPQQTSAVTPIQAQGSKLPLFCIAPPNVNAIGYTVLARCLDAEQPVYLLQSPSEPQGKGTPEPAEMPDLHNERVVLSASEVPALVTQYIAGDENRTT